MEQNAPNNATDTYRPSDTPDEATGPAPVDPAVPAAEPSGTPAAAAQPLPLPDPWALDPPLGAPAPAPVPRPAFALRRSRTDRMLGGVCGGLAVSLGVDAALLRVALVVLTVFGFGLGAVFYLAAWYLAPEEDVAA